MIMLRMDWFRSTQSRHMKTCRQTSLLSHFKSSPSTYVATCVVGKCNHTTWRSVGISVWLIVIRTLVYSKYYDLRISKHLTWVDESWLWFVVLCNDLKAGTLRCQIASHEDYKDSKCRAIYKCVEPIFCWASAWSNQGRDKAAGANLETICHSLIKSAMWAKDPNLLMWCCFVMTALGLGRGGASVWEWGVAGWLPAVDAAAQDSATASNAVWPWSCIIFMQFLPLNLDVSLL